MKQLRISTKNLYVVIAVAVGTLIAAIAIGWTLQSSKIASKTSASAIFAGSKFRLLVVGDPFANALRLSSEELSRRSGAQIDIEIAGYNDVRVLTLQNSKDLQSVYDIVSFDVVWFGEYTKANVLAPIHLELDKNLHPEDFLPRALSQTIADKQYFGLPIQPHPEMLWVRVDLLAEAGLTAPSTTEELLVAAKTMMRKQKSVYGLCWNGQRGQALGQQMAHFYAAYGQPLLNSDGVPTINTQKGLAAAKFANSLLAVSPPDILSMAWDQRTRSFARGDCAMTFEWGARSYIAERDPMTAVRGKVKYLPAPHASNARPVTPLGTWSLGIPANLGTRLAESERFILWLSEPQQQLLLAENGNGGMPRMSQLSNPTLIRIYPAFPTVEKLGKDSQLDDWMRPQVPQWSSLADVLGTVFHDMLKGEMSPEAAVELAQQKAEALFSASGKNSK